MRHTPGKVERLSFLGGYPAMNGQKAFLNACVVHYCCNCPSSDKSEGDGYAGGKHAECFFGCRIDMLASTGSRNG
jgi:hypothetical protein